MILVLTTHDQIDLYEINKVGIWYDIQIDFKNFTDDSYTAFVYFTKKGIARKLRITLWEGRIIYKILEGTSKPIPLHKLRRESIFTLRTKLQGSKFYLDGKKADRLIELWEENKQPS